MVFERISIDRPGAYARGWVADREGVHHEARRGFGGQARTTTRLLQEPAFAHVERVGWVANLKATRRGTGALVLQTLLDRFFDADVDFVGPIALPDDDRYLPRLIDYYRRFGFEIVADADSYPVMVRPRPRCTSH